MYSLKNVFTQSPVKIAAAVVLILNLAMSFGLDLTGDQVGLINLAIVGVLSLLVYNSVTPVANATLAAGTEVKVEGTEDTSIV
jgi:hypothetical protein